MTRQILVSTKLVGVNQAFTLKAYPGESTETIDFTDATLAFKYTKPDGNTTGTISASEGTHPTSGRQTIEAEVTEEINDTTGYWYFQPIVTFSGYSNPVPGWPKLKQQVLSF